MTNFPELNTEGLGGQQSFSFIPVHDVDIIPYVFNSVLPAAVILLNGKQWYTGNALMRTLQLTEEPTKQGTYNYSLSGNVAGKDSDVVPLFTDMARRTFLIDTTDRNGNRRLIGSKNFPMRFKWSHDSKASTSERSDFIFEFYGETPAPAPVYTPA